jgi:anti-anti-sigma regulatory factor
MMLKLLAGERVPEQTMLPAKLVVRQSCGCSEPVIMHAAAGPVKRRAESLGEAIIAQREAILSEMGQVIQMPVSLSSEWTDRILDAFVEEMMSDLAPQKAFLSVLDDVLRQAIAMGGQVNGWQEALSVMRRHVLPYLTDAETLTRGEDLFNQGRVMIGKVAQWYWARREAQETWQTEVLGNLGGDMVAAVEREQIFDVIGRTLPALDLATFYLSFYDGQEHPAEWSRLMLAYDEGKRIEVDADGWRFPTRQLVPGDLLSPERRYTWVVESLNFRENQFGCLVIEAGSCRGSIYGMLTRQISGALQDLLLVRQVREQTAERERAQEENTRLQQEVIETQRQALRELSTPIIPVMDRIIVMPLIGNVDSARARDITRSLLAGIREHRARVVILDITGVSLVDSGVAGHLNKTIHAARLKGAHTIITGISDAVAETVLDLGIEWGDVETLSDLQTGLRAALARMGLRVG